MSQKTSYVLINNKTGEPIVLKATSLDATLLEILKLYDVSLVEHTSYFNDKSIVGQSQKKIS